MSYMVPVISKNILKMPLHRDFKPCHFDGKFKAFFNNNYFAARKKSCLFSCMLLLTIFGSL